MIKTGDLEDTTKVKILCIKSMILNKIYRKL